MDKYFEALEKSKGSIELNVVNQVGFDETADVLEKGKRAQMGEVRVWNGQKFQKTPKGWIPVKEEGKGEKDDKKYSENAQKALDFIKDDLDFFTEPEPENDGKAIKLSNIGYKKYQQLCKKLTDAGFELKEGFADYYPGDDERQSEGVIRIAKYKPKKK